MVKSTETEIAVLQNQMADVKTSLETIKADQHTNFQALASKIDSLSTTPLALNTLTIRVSNLERSKNKEWLRNTASAVAGAVLASLIIYAIVKT